MNRHVFVPATYVLLIRDDKILMMSRFNTGYGDGMYTLPGGHVEAGEKLADCAAREVKEEVALVVKPNDLSLCHTMRRSEPEGDRIDFFYETLMWTGAVLNNEPKKCDGIIWTPMRKLPDNTLPYIKQFIDHYLHARLFSEIFIKASK